MTLLLARSTVSNEYDEIPDEYTTDDDGQMLQVTIVSCGSVGWRVVIHARGAKFDTQVMGVNKTKCSFLSPAPVHCANAGNVE